MEVDVNRRQKIVTEKKSPAPKNVLNVTSMVVIPSYTRLPALNRWRRSSRPEWGALPLSQIMLLLLRKFSLTSFSYNFASPIRKQHPPIRQLPLCPQQHPEPSSNNPAPNARDKSPPCVSGSAKLRFPAQPPAHSPLTSAISTIAWWNPPAICRRRAVFSLVASRRWTCLHHPKLEPDWRNLWPAMDVPRVPAGAWTVSAVTQLMHCYQSPRPLMAAYGYQQPRIATMSIPELSGSRGA